MRKFEYHTFNETTQGIRGITLRFSYERGLFEKTNPALLKNFIQCAKWIEKNCPNLNGVFKCEHQVYHWTKLVVEDGKAYLEYGSHGEKYKIALSQTETAIFTRGSQQSIPYAFKELFFRNDALEEFLSQWQSIKRSVISTYSIQSKVFSDEFTA